MNVRTLDLVCPRCRHHLQEDGINEQVLFCTGCCRTYPVIAGIPDVRTFSDPYIDRASDHAKGLRVAERARDTDFAGLLEFYYSITDVVPPEHARRYTRGILTSSARAGAALRAWENGKANGRDAGSMSFLEIGCGTGPLLVAASRRYANTIGVDIAFRWLVVAQKRLSEEGIDVPLICACAEALPFPDQTFDRVAADSALETVRSQRRTLREVERVLTPGGQLFVATPNAFSVGPDPHFGIWCAGYFPKRWIDARVVRQGGIPAKRELLSLHRLRARIREADLQMERVFLPDIPDEQRVRFSGPMRLAIALYSLVKRLPGVRQLLYYVGPLLYAVVRKPDGLREPL